jgi:hypothetical protein
MSNERPPAIIDAVRERIRIRHYSPRTDMTSAGWIRRYVNLCGRRHSREPDSAEITTFLTHLAVESDTLRSAALHGINF